MKNPTINFLLNDAIAAIHGGRPLLAHRLMCRADRLAHADRTVSAERREQIRNARLICALSLSI